MAKSGITCTFAYDANGMRSRRTVMNSSGTTTYYYTYTGSQLTHMTVGGYTLHFYYDANGYPMSVMLNGVTYYYVTNLQGDVIGILNNSGTQIVEYAYDAWGKAFIANVIPGSYETTIATLNPLRYRGYVYDYETELYYLQSRYYNPAMGRFINADALVSTGQGILGNNMFAYCNNNPVIRCDYAGNAFETIFDVLSLGASVLEVAFNPADPFAWLGLAGDAVDLIPFVTGIGETIRACKIGSKVAEGADNAIDTYRHLKKINKGLDIEVHHIVEKRFAKTLGFSKSGGLMQSIALSNVDHRVFTNDWRRLLPYGSSYGEKEILQTAIKVYANNPQLLGAAIFTLVTNKMPHM